MTLQRACKGALTRKRLQDEGRSRPEVALPHRELLSSGRLSDWSRCGGVHGSHVDIEQGLVLVALVLVLFAKPDDLFQHLDIEALALGFREDLLLLLVELL